MEMEEKEYNSKSDDLVSKNANGAHVIKWWIWLFISYIHYYEVTVYHMIIDAI